MTQQTILVGTSPNDGLGDPIRTAFIKTNANFNQLYARAQSTPPSTPVGIPGDLAGMYAYDSTYFYYCFANYDGSSVIWAQVTQIGNISVPTIQNGNSNVAIASANGNATISINGVTDVAVFSANGADITGYLAVSGNLSATNNINTSNIIATGNITGNYFIGDGSQLTGLPSVYGNANVAAFLPTYTGILSPGAVYTDGYYWANSIPVAFGGGNSNYNNANVAAFLPTYTGNIGATLTDGYQPYITTVGNLTGLTVDGLSSVILNPIGASVTIAPSFGGIVTISPTGIGSIDNMSIGTLIPQPGSFTNVSATGNVTGAYIIGDGSFLTNVSGTGGGNYGNANVAAFLPTYTGNISGDNISLAGNIDVAGNVNGVVNGQLYGLVNGVNPAYGAWDFGYIATNTSSKLD